MILNFISLTLNILGKVLIAYTAIQVHYRVWKEHKIDDEVFIGMKREQIIGFLGIVLMIIAYLIDIYLL